MSIWACVVISPKTTTSPVVTAVSHATRECGSCARQASSTASEIWSHILSGCPSVTDSEVSRNELEWEKEVGMAAFLGSGFPGLEVLLLFARESVDSHLHRGQFQPRHALVDLRRHRDHARPRAGHGLA